MLGRWAKGLLGLRVAHEAAMLQDSAGVLKDARQAVKSHQDMVAADWKKQLTSEVQAIGANGEDDMGIHVGDKIEHHHHTPPHPPKPGAGKLATAALVTAAVLGGGLGAAALTGQLWPRQPSTNETSPAAPAAKPTAKPQEYEWQMRIDGGPWRPLAEGPVEAKP